MCITETITEQTRFLLSWSLDEFCFRRYCKLGPNHRVSQHLDDCVADSVNASMHQSVRKAVRRAGTQARRMCKKQEWLTKKESYLTVTFRLPKIKSRLTCLNERVAVWQRSASTDVATPACTRPRGAWRCSNFPFPTCECTVRR